MPGAQVPGATDVDTVLASLTSTHPLIDGRNVTMNQVLTQDRTVAIDYACA
jgi:hypothetical protein